MCLGASSAFTLQFLGGVMVFAFGYGLRANPANPGLCLWLVCLGMVCCLSSPILAKFSGLW